MRFDRNRARLELTNDELKTLVRLAVGDVDAATCDESWSAEGIVDGSRVHPVAAGMAIVAVEPDRGVAIERFDGKEMAPLWIGFDEHGRATLTEPTTDGRISIVATQISLMPALVIQALRLNPAKPRGDGRAAMTVTAGDIDDVLAQLGSGAPETPTGEDPPVIESLLSSFDSAWRATGSWRGQPGDLSMTILDAGSHGLWLVDTDRERDAVADRETPVCLTPVTVAEVTSVLGDVVTGRTTPPRGPGDDLTESVDR